MSGNEHKQTRSEQRNAARDKARQLREEHARKERSKKVWVRALIAIVVVGIIGGVTIGVVAGVQQQNAVNSAGNPANMTFDDGIKLGANLEAFTSSHTPVPTPAPTSTTAVPNIKIYLDFQCPICQMFEQGNGQQLRSWVKSGAATLEIHPISFLDRSSPNKYSSRAANAAICVANYSPDNFFDFYSLLYQHQPAEGTNGPENAELIQRTQEVGVKAASSIADCINNTAYSKWLGEATNKALTASTLPGTTNTPLKGTPTVLVNNQQYTFATTDELTNPARFAAFVQQVSK